MIRLFLFYLQYVEYTIHRGVLGANKDVQHVVLEYRGDPVQPGRRSKFDSSQSLVLPALPTTLVGVCRMINVYYALHVRVHFESSRRLILPLLIKMLLLLLFYFILFYFFFLIHTGQFTLGIGGRGLDNGVSRNNSHRSVSNSQFTKPASSLLRYALHFNYFVDSWVHRQKRVQRRSPIKSIHLF